MNLYDEINKENLTDYQYADMAVWCNENNAIIVDCGFFYRIEPTPPPSDKEVAISRIAELEAYLSDTDYMAIKCMERGLSMSSEYPDDYVKRQEARDEINRLRVVYM